MKPRAEDLDALAAEGADAPQPAALVEAQVGDDRSVARRALHSGGPPAKDAVARHDAPASLLLVGTNLPCDFCGRDLGQVETRDAPKGDERSVRRDHGDQLRGQVGEARRRHSQGPNEQGR